MNATAVASSSQMFSPFGQATQGSSPAINPFAAKSAGGGAPSGFGGAGDSNRAQNKQQKPWVPNHGNGQSKSRNNNPFQNKNAAGSDGEGKNKKRAGEKERRGAGSRMNSKMRDGPKQSKLRQTHFPNGLRQPTPSDDDESRPTSASSASSSTEMDPSATFNSNDPHARKMYEQLRKDNICPPQWPSQPGNIKSKSAMAKFREQYETYRGKVRASLTKAGLIDDPEKRKNLSDAIPFKGICEDMCPEFEKITRITEIDVYQPEKDRTTGYANTGKMVKKLARSAAGQEAPLPMDVRSVPALRRTLDYLIDNVMRSDANLPALHGFLWDRTRAIRRDFSFFSSMTREETKTQIYIFENITRFHVTALHLLSQPGKAGEDFVEQQELEQLGKSLLSLRDLYDNCNEQGIECENETEFRAYYLLFHGHDPSIMDILQRQWKSSYWRDSEDIRTAVSLVEALRSTQDLHGPLEHAPSLNAIGTHNAYFKIVEKPIVSYTMACFAECHFAFVRRSILSNVKRSLSRPKVPAKDVTAAVLNSYLQFDTVQQAIDFAQFHGLEFLPDEQHPADVDLQHLVLSNRSPLPHPRLTHQFSQRFVEKKRGKRPLPDAIHRTVYEDASSSGGDNPTTEESLFVEDSEPEQPPTQLPLTKPSPFSSLTPPAGSSGNAGFASGFQATPSNPLNASKPTTQPSAPAGNPFASAPKSPNAQPPPNPFTSTIPSKIFPTLRDDATLKPQSTISTPKLAQQPTSFASIPQPPSISDNIPFTTAEKSTVPKPTTPSFPASLQPSGPKPAFPGAIPNQSTAKTALPSPQPTQPPAPPSQSFQSSPFASKPPASVFPPASSAGATVQSQTPLPSFVGPSKTLGASSIFPPTSTTAPAKPAIGSQLGSSGSFGPKTSSPSTGLTRADSGTISPKTLPPSGNTANSSFAQPPAVQIPPIVRVPPRDLLGDFAKWFVKGDGGLLSEFQVFMVEDLTRKAYDQFVAEVEEKKRLEEKKREDEAVRKFRTYNLSLRYFYRWKELARERRLKTLRRQGREQMRAFYESQQAALVKEQKEAARKAAKQRAEIEALNRPEEFRDMLKHQQETKSKAWDARQSLSATEDIGPTSARSVRHNMDPPPRRPAPMSGRSSRSPSVSSTRTGAKTSALREELFGGGSARFRRSLPPMSAESDSPEITERVSGVSARWRLKAMGIVQLPDGTAVPESMAREMSLSSSPRLQPSREYGLGSRRASISGAVGTSGQRNTSTSLNHHRATTSSGLLAPAATKRKRPSGDDGEQGGDNAHKRVMSDAEKLVSELRALREDMEEGATWFRTQNERLQSEISSRGATPWDEEASI